MTMEKDSFLLYRRHKTLFDKLDDEKKALLITAIFNYQFEGVSPNFPEGALDMAFASIKDDLDRNAKKYEAITEKRRQAGRNHSGNQYTRKMEQLEQMSQNGTIGTNGTDSDSVSDSVFFNNENNIENKQKKRFIKPNIEEIKAYCQEKGYQINAEAFFDYYEANGWKVGRNPMKDWKATVRNWARRDGEAISKRQQITVQSKGMKLM